MKSLIWTKYLELKNVGGPCGYLYNVKTYLDEHPSGNIDFYPIEYKEPTKYIPKGGLLLKLRNLLKSIMVLYRFFKKVHFNYYKHEELSDSDKALLMGYDFIHIHNIPDYRRNFLGFDNKHTKKILTTHYPEPMIDEIAGEFDVKWIFKVIPGFRDFFLRKEIEVYKDADYIMLPVAEAQEPYINKSKHHKKAFEEIKEKFFYVPTCLSSVEKNEVNEHVLDKYNIPEGALKVCYVGRHTEVKGYDTIQRLATEMWNEGHNVYFIIGGKEDPIKGLKHPKWIELGWVKTQSLLNEVDCFLLPNKDTYFDLILLEVLRQGTPIVLTRTGGNKWFEGKDTNGMFFYDKDDIQAAKDCILKLAKEKQKNSLDDLCNSNLKFYKDTFDMKNYVSQYVNSLNKIHS